MSLHSVTDSRLVSIGAVVAFMPVVMVVIIIVVALEDREVHKAASGGILAHHYTHAWGRLLRWLSATLSSHQFLAVISMEVTR